MKHLLKNTGCFPWVFFWLRCSPLFMQPSSPLPEKVPVLFLNFVPRFFAKR